MKPIFKLARRAHLGVIAVLFILAAAACGSAGTDDKDRAAPAVSVDEVREQVRQFALGGGEKDVAGEKFYNWGESAHPALAQLARDPTLTDEELATMMFIVAVYAHTDALFDAVRTRIEAMPDTEARTVRLGLLEEYRAMPGVTKP